MLVQLAVWKLSVPYLTMYVAPFVPFVVPALAKVRAPGWVKTALSAGVATVVAIVTTAIEEKSDLILSWAMFGRVAIAMGTAGLSYLLLRATPVMGKVEKAAAPEKGIG